MEPRPHLTRRPLLPLLALALATGACDLSLPWSTAPGAQQAGGGPAGGGSSLSFSPAEIKLQAWLRGPAPEAWLTFPDVPPDVILQVLATQDLAAVPGAGQPPGGGRGALLRGASPDILGIGTHRGTLQIRASRGGTPVQGSPFTVPYEYIVEPAALEPLAPEAAMNLVLGATSPPPIVVPVLGAPGAGPWTVTVAYPGLNPNNAWLQAVGDGQIPGRLTLTSAGAPQVLDWVDQAIVTVTRAGQSEQILVTRTFRLPQIIVSSDPMPLTGVAVVGSPLLVSFRVETEASVPVSVRLFARNVSAPDGASSTWLNCVPVWRTAPVTLTCNVFGIPAIPGRYTATAVFELMGRAPVELPVSLDVTPNPLRLGASAAGFTLTQREPPESLRLDLTVTAPFGPVSWTAGSDEAWLEVSPASGTAAPGAPSVLSVTLRPAALIGVSPRPSGGYVWVRSDADGRDRWAWLGLTYALPSLNRMAPLRDVEGQGGEVVLVGDGLSPAPDVRFGDLPAVSVRSLSATEARAVPPALPPGEVTVTMPSASGLVLGSARYQVLPAASLPPLPSSAAAPGRKVRLAWDDVRGQLLVVNTGGEALERWRPGDGWTLQALSLPGILDATPTLDGTRVVVLAGGVLDEVDPVALTPLPSPYPKLPLAPDGATRLAALATDDVLVGIAPSSCTAVGCPVGIYRAADRTLWLDWYGGAGTRLGASRSGFRAALAADLAGFPSALSVRSGAFQLSLPSPWPGPFLADEVSVDRHGDTILLLRVGAAGGGDSVLLDGTLTPRPGKLPPTIEAAVLTQAGDRAVCFDRADGMVRIFDLWSPPDAATGLFLQVGAPLAPDQPLGDAVTLALSGDDRLLFLGGDLALAVLPLP